MAYKKCEECRHNPYEKESENGFVGDYCPVRGKFLTGDQPEKMECFEERGLLLKIYDGIRGKMEEVKAG